MYKFYWNYEVVFSDIYNQMRGFAIVKVWKFFLFCDFWQTSLFWLNFLIRFLVHNLDYTSNNILEVDLLLEILDCKMETQKYMEVGLSWCMIFTSILQWSLKLRPRTSSCSDIQPLRLKCEKRNFRIASFRTLGCS